MHLVFKLLIAALWLFLLVVAFTDCLKSHNEHKTRWIALIMLLPFLGPLLYFRFAQGRFVSEL